MHPLKDLGRRFRSAISRGKSTTVTPNNIRVLMQVQGLGGQVFEKGELHLPFGMSANPKPGGDNILLFIGGSSSHVIALHNDDSGLRITDLQIDEFGFRDRNGQQVVFRQDHIEVTTSKKVIANVGTDLDATVGGNVNLAVTGNVTGSAAKWNLTGDMTLTGNFNATGNVSDSVRSMAADRGDYDGHGHTGVKAGSDISGGPTVIE